MPKSKRGRPQKYDPRVIGWRTVQIIKTLGADRTKSAVAVAFYDTKFNLDEQGEKQRLLNNYRRMRKGPRKAELKSKLVGYSQLLVNNRLDYQKLVAAVEDGMSDLGLFAMIGFTAAAKKEGKKNRGSDLLSTE